LHPDEPDNAELETLLLRCSRQDSGALEEIFRRISSILLAVLVRMLRSRDLAEDALQDVFILIWSRAGQFDSHRGRAMAWMVGIARNRAIDILRSRKEDVSLDVVPEPVVVDRASESSLTKRSLAQCFSLLSGEQRRCLELAYEHGLSHEGIAATLSTPLGTVKSWVRRGLVSLRRCLGS
jgi:RNA polymerase sigma-70 factor (ECF subfamily)